MQVFVSSLISGFEEERAVAKRAIEVLRHRAVMAEDFGARASSPQVACLAGVRQADLVVLILGDRYGSKQASGLSATHEEYREARGKKPIIVLVRTEAPEPDQTDFIAEVSGWEQGLFRAAFATSVDLGEQLTLALHNHELAHAQTPVDPAGLARRALKLLPEVNRNQGGMQLQLAMAVGPQATLLRPAQMENPALPAALANRALFGQGHPSIFALKSGTDHRLEDHALVVFQGERYERDAEVRLWASGDMRLILPIGDRSERRGGLPVLIEEDVSERIMAGLGYLAWLLDHLDPLERQSHVALAARIAGQGAMGWRTLAEHQAQPNSGSFGGFGDEEKVEKAVQLSPPHRVRQALAMSAALIGEDFLVLLRRLRKQ